jgi:hypothetical protein
VAVDRVQKRDAVFRSGLGLVKISVPIKRAIIVTAGH